MTPEHFRRLQQAFDHATGLNGPGQSAYLHDLGKSDPALAAEVVRLMARDTAEAGPDDLEEVVARAAAAMSSTVQPLIDQTMGAYVVDELIAEGGMGLVFRGHRSDAAFEQEVAIKVLASPIFSEEASLRFRTERQILANLKHPWIAELYDGGTTGQGFPFLVMELIDGKPIDAWCDSHGLSIRARLEVFLKVCSAVSHAHANLIVHRDIKPSNILVRPDGTPKLLDFGIAKVLDETLATSAAQTLPDARAMTPEYASPEQILGEAVTTATDVYGLGLLLHRLLAGRHPYQVQGKRPSEVEQTICESPPTPPSRSVLEAGPDVTPGAEEIVTRRRTTPRRLHRALVGDLDNIVLCALQKEPRHRYPSVTAFAEDIRRYLNHEAVTARPVSLTYLTGRFLRRHWLGASFSLTLALLVSGFALNASFQANALRIERNAAEATIEFLIGMFRLADPRLTEPGYVLPETVTVRDLLTLGSRRIDELSDHPQVQARLLNAIGMAYQSIGEFGKARGFFQRALSLRQALGEHPAVIAESLSEQGWLYFEQSRYRSAMAALEQAISLLDHANADEARIKRDALINLSMVHMSTGNLDQADLLLDRARDIEAAAGNIVDESQIAATLHNQAIVHWERGYYEQARNMEEQVIEIWERTLHANHPYLGAAYNFMATLYVETGESYPLAMELYEKALAADEFQLGPDHPDVARNLLDLAQLDLTMGDVELARKRNLRALTILTDAFGPVHRYVGVANIQLADTEQTDGNAGEARAYLEAADRAFAGRESTDEDFLAWAGIIRARILKDEGEIRQASLLVEESRATFEQIRGPGHPDTLGARLLLAELALLADDFGTAFALSAEVGKLIRENALTDHPVAINWMEMEARLAVSRGDQQAAARWKARVEAFRTGRYGNRP